MVADRTYFAAVMTSLYATLLGRDTTGYQHAPSDSWTKVRVPLEFAAHLECWIDLGTDVTLTKPGWLNRGHVVYSCRYVPDDDEFSQSINHASIRDCSNAMISWSYGAARCLNVGPVSILQTESDWVTITVPILIQLPRSL